MELPPRYLISKLVLQNFKSYSGMQVIDRVHCGFSAVVGPNGSGKSNLLEALIFAFGKRASTMRSKRIEDLIHKSDTREDLDFASVSVHFSPVDGGKDTVLERVVLQSGVSHYKVDGRKESMETVVGRLKGLGVDIERNRFMILQGEVELLSSMEPKCGYEDDQGNPISKEGLLEYFDDLIGTREYHSKLIHTQQAINSLQCRLPPLNESQRMLEERLESLKAPLREVVKHIRTKLEVFQLTNVRLQFEKCNKLGEKRGVEEEKVTFERKKEKLVKRFIELKEKHKEILKEIEDLEGKKKLLEQEKAQGKQKFDNLEAHFQEQNNNLRRCEEKKADIEKKVAKSQHELSTFESNLSTITDKIAEKEESKTKETAKLQDLLAILTPARDQADERIRPFVSELAPLLQEIREREGQRDQLTQQMQEKQARKEGWEQQVRDLQGNQQALQQRIQTLRRDLAALSTGQSRNREPITALKSHLEQAKSALQTSERDLAQAENAHSEAQRRSNQAQKTVRKARLNALMHQRIQEACARGKLPGVLGRLGDLGSVPAHFDTAVSTIYGRTMDNYVTKTVEQAEMLIDYLREQQIGRVTVYPLAKMAAVPGNFRTPDSQAVRIYDQVQPIGDPEVLKVFYHIFRDTLITESLEKARKVAFDLEKRWDVATFSGEILRKAGDMQGFGQPRQGSIRVHSDQARRVTGDSEERDLEDRVRSAAERLEAIKREVSRCRAEKQAVEQEYERRRVDEELERERERLLRAELQTIEAEVGEIPPIDTIVGQIRDSELQISTLQGEIHTAEAALAPFLATKTTLETHLNSLKSAELRSMETQELQLTVSIRTLELAIEEQERRLKRTKDQYISSKGHLEDYNQHLQGLQADIERFQQSTKELEIQAQGVMQQVNQLSKAEKENVEVLEAKKAAQPEVKLQFERVESKGNRLKSKIRDLEKQIGNLEGALIAVLEKIQTNRIQYVSELDQYQDALKGLRIGESEEESNDFFAVERKRFKSFDKATKFLIRVDQDLEESQISDSDSPDKPEWQYALSEITRRLDNIKERIESFQLDWHVVEDYREAFQRQIAVKAEVNAVYSELSTSRLSFIELRNERLEKFKAGFDVVNSNLKSIYRLFTSTGAAEIEFVDSADPFAEGLFITVRPPGKSWKRLSVLSGGEKTLVSLSLIFALHDYKPNSIYIMDEIDASLDYLNVQKVADYIRQRKSTAQFLIVSLRCQMFEAADQLIGIYKPQHESQVLSILPRSEELRAWAAENVIVRNSLSC